MSKQVKKIIPYCLILIILVGLFSPIAQVNAQVPPLGGPNNPTQPQKPPTPTPTPAPAPDNTSEFQKNIDTGCDGLFNSSVTGCLLKLFYYTYFQLPTFALWLAGLFFNAMISLGISSSITSSAGFIPSAWAVVRDLSNIFFILILLYIAIKLILGLGGHEAKIMIRNVIIIALLINFSMFFTKVVIDSSNILALVFYNKLDVQGTNSDGKPREYTPSTPNNEKDLSGFFYAKFDATRLLTGDSLNKLKTTMIDGKPVTADKLPFGLTMGMMFIAGSIMLVAAYTFLVSAFMFIGRLIELWVLIIFSPFAFMSFPVPILSSAPYIGWGEWSKRLLSTSFMAPIFMFFMYLISKLIGADIFTRFTTGTGAIATILEILIPAMIILALLLKATKYAEKGGGQFGEIVMKGAKVVGGLAVTAAAAAATGGTALALRAGIGAGGGALAGKAAEFAEKKGFNRVGGGLRDIKSFAQKSSFDVRSAPGVSGLAKASGINLGEAQKGGWTEMKKQQVEKRQKRAEELEKRAIVREKVKVDDAEIKLKEAILPVKLDLANVDKDIDKARIEMNDAKNAGDVAGVTEWKNKLDEAKRNKARIRGAKYTDASGKLISEVSGGIASLEKEVHKAKQELDVASDKVTTDYAKKISSSANKTLNQILRLGQYSRVAADEAARRIRTGTKLDSGEKPH